MDIISQWDNDDNTKTYLFEDDVSVDVDNKNNVVDMDGIGTVSDERKRQIEEERGVKIIL